MAALALCLWRRQGLHRRLPDDTTLPQAMTASEAPRQAANATMAWRFTTTDAREKRQRLYPSPSQ
jgi:hypothetical protein